MIPEWPDDEELRREGDYQKALSILSPPPPPPEPVDAMSPPGGVEQWNAEPVEEVAPPMVKPKESVLSRPDYWLHSLSEMKKNTPTTMQLLAGYKPEQEKPVSYEQALLEKQKGAYNSRLQDPSSIESGVLRGSVVSRLKQNAELARRNGDEEAANYFDELARNSEGMSGYSASQLADNPILKQAVSTSLYKKPVDAQVDRVLRNMKSLKSPEARKKYIESEISRVNTQIQQIDSQMQSGDRKPNTSRAELENQLAELQSLADASTEDSSSLKPYQEFTIPQSASAAFDKRVVAERNILDQLPDIQSILDNEDIQNAGVKLLGTKLAKFAGDKGALSNYDVERYINQSGIVQQMQQAYRKGVPYKGKTVLTSDLKRELTKLAGIVEHNAKQRMFNKAHEYAYQKYLQAPGIGISPERYYNALAVDYDLAGFAPSPESLEYLKKRKIPVFSKAVDLSEKAPTKAKAAPGDDKMKQFSDVYSKLEKKEKRTEQEDAWMQKYGPAVMKYRGSSGGK